MTDVTVWIEIPATVRVTNYRPAVPARIVGSWELSDPAEPSEFDAEILINGEPAEWAREYLENDWGYIEQEYLKQLEREQ